MREKDFGFQRGKRETKGTKKRVIEVLDEVREAKVEEAEVVVDKVVVEAEELIEPTTSGQSQLQQRRQKLCESDESQEGQSSADENSDQISV